MQLWWEKRGHHLTRHLVHGDYGGENILWSKDRIVALLDFGMVDLHERVIELAYSLYWMLMRLEGKKPLRSSTTGTLRRWPKSRWRSCRNPRVFYPDCSGLSSR